MSPDPSSEVFACPQHGCGAEAIGRVEDLSSPGRYFLWQCVNGHRGPRFIADLEP
ncbi:MAG: hypothetical protein ACTHJL_14410 [Amnibacterium sp.]